RLFPRARVIQIDERPQAVRHNRAVAQFHLRADARLGVAALNKHLSKLNGEKTGYRTEKTERRLRENEQPVPERAADGLIDPRRAVQEINRVVPKDWLLVGGSGHCAYFTA